MKMSPGLKLGFGAFAISAAVGCNDTSLSTGPVGTDDPIAVIDGQASYSPLDTAQFSGLNSYDPDGGTIATYDWAMTLKPAGSNSSIQSVSADGAQVEFFVDFAGDYEITLTVTDDEGAQGSETFEFNAVPWQAIHVELAWDIDTSDVDLHLVDETMGGTYYTPPGDCFYANTAPDWGNPATTADDPSLDIDDVDGYGPENINLQGPIDGHRYHVFIHYFSDDGLGATAATARIYLSGVLQYEQVRSLTNDQVWDVATIDWPSGTITEINTTFMNP